MSSKLELSFRIDQLLKTPNSHRYLGSGDVVEYKLGAIGVSLYCPQVSPPRWRTAWDESSMYQWGWNTIEGVFRAEKFYPGRISENGWLEIANIVGFLEISKELTM